MKRFLIVLLAGLLLCFFATGTAGAQLTGYIDVANDGNNNTAIAYPAGTLTVSGWAADLNPVVAPVNTVQVFIDGNLVGNATLNQSRPDVATYFNNQALLPSGWTFTVPIKNLGLSFAQHTVSAVASDPYYSNVSLGPSSSSCCVITVAEADLIESVPTVTGTVASGGSIQIQETTSDQAAVGAGISWTRMYLNTSNAKGGTLLATRTISSLTPYGTAGASSTGTSKVTLPLNIGGTYYVVACANDTGSVVESNYSNNCNGVQVTVQAADLTVTADSFPVFAATGTTILATETTANLGAGSPSTTWTRFYLNKTTPSKTGGTLVGTQTVPGLTSGGSYVGATNINVPSNVAAGTYYLVACANDTNSATETNYANNCMSQQLTLVTATGAAIVDATNGNDASTTCSTAAPCKTITHALSISPPRTVVLAKPGTYTEQVVIQRNVTLTSTSPYAAVIQPPTSLTADPNDTATSLVFVGAPASSVAISNMTIQGAGAGNCGLTYGVFVTAGTATVTGNKVLTIGDPSCTSGGLAIRFGDSDMGYTYTAAGVISNNVVSSYRMRGIVVDDSTANVTGNIVTGAGGTPAVSPAGIVIRTGAQSTVSGNTVSQNTFGTLCPSHADGILLAALAGGVNVTNNTVTANDEGVGIYSRAPSGGSFNSTNISIMSNTVFNNAFLGVHIDGNSGGNTVELNTIYGNGQDDEVDETGSWTSPNNWGTDPTNYNILGNGGPYTQFLGSLGCTWQ